MFRAAFLGVVAGALMLAAVPAFAECAAGAGVPATVTEVIDGDTIVLGDGRTIRLVGVEAPKRLPGQAQGSVPAVVGEAREALESLVLGEEISIQVAGEQPDRYGRSAAIVSLAGRSLQDMLVERGLARLRGPTGGCLSSLSALEKAARRAGIGVWKDPDFAVRDADDPSLPTQKGLYGLVEGRVASVGRGSRMVFLNFGRDWKRDFTVTMTTDLAKRLAGRDDPADAFTGKRVLVRGVIEENGGPLIRVTDESGIEILSDDGTGAAD
jgi:endonuclease YncB( thermonuclease family)